MSSPAVVLPAAGALTRRRNQFHSYASAALLLIVIAGFSPTLFARGAFFAVPPIPSYLFAHGFVLTGWFAWLLVQARLAGSGRLALHRKLGTAGALYAVAVAAGALMATMGVVRRVVGLGIRLDADISALGQPGLGQNLSVLNFLAAVVWMNIGSVVAFAVLVALAVALRRRPEAHKRLMLLASVAIIGPALARISRWPGLGGEQGPFVLSALLVLFAAIVANDLWTRRRPHPATVFGIAFILSTNSVAGRIAATELGLTFVRGLS